MTPLSTFVGCLSFYAQANLGPLSASLLGNNQPASEKFRPRLMVSLGRNGPRDPAVVVVVVVIGSDVTIPFAPKLMPTDNVRLRAHSPGNSPRCENEENFRE